MTAPLAPPLTDTAMHLEAQRLLLLGDEISAFLPQGRAEFLRPWRGKVEAWIHHPELESLTGEQALHALALELRYRWLQHTHLQSDRYMMSPPHNQRKRLPDLQAFGFPYDRWLKPTYLERRLNAERAAPQGWKAESVVFSSGMSAITTVMQHHHATGDSFWPSPRKGLALHWFGGYFELMRAMRLVCVGGFKGRLHAKQETLNQAVAQGRDDIVLIEPVAADIDLDVFDLDAFIAAWKQRDVERTCMVVVDTSLTGDAFPLHRLCTDTGPRPPALVVHLSSGLKLDQEGLELSNVGLVTLYMPDDENNASLLNRVAESLRQARTTMGASLSEDEYAALSAPFFLSAPSLHRHAQAIFANNAKFAQALAPFAKTEGGLWTKIIHPSLSAHKDKAWAVSPFVNLRYAHDRQTFAEADKEGEARDVLRAVLEFEADKRGLVFQSGSSFGFRGHRFEMGFVRGVKYDSLRLAIGSRAGPSLDGVIQLFKDLAVYKDFAALREAYPGVWAARLKARSRTRLPR